MLRLFIDEIGLATTNSSIVREGEICKRMRELEAGERAEMLELTWRWLREEKQATPDGPWTYGEIINHACILHCTFDTFEPLKWFTSAWSALAVRPLAFSPTLALSARS